MKIDKAMLKREAKEWLHSIAVALVLSVKVKLS